MLMLVLMLCLLGVGSSVDGELGGDGKVGSGANAWKKLN